MKKASSSVVTFRHHQQALARLGYQVTLTPPGDGTHPPNPGPGQQPAA
jgi:hypothetical protein